MPSRFRRPEMIQEASPTLQKILFHIPRAKFIYPKTRPHKSESIYAAVQRQIQPEKETRAQSSRPPEKY